MAQKPQPRRSALSNAHPYAPAELEATPQAPASAPEQTPPAIVNPAPAPRVTKTGAASAKPAQAKAEKKPMSVRATEADQGRIRAAFLATNSAERHGSLSDFIVTATLARVAQLEEQYNGGKPWAAAVAGEVPTGRPVR